MFEKIKTKPRNCKMKRNWRKFCFSFKDNRCCISATEESNFPSQKHPFGSFSPLSSDQIARISIKFTPSTHPYHLCRAVKSQFSAPLHTLLGFVLSDKSRKIRLLTDSRIKKTFNRHRPGKLSANQTVITSSALQ